MENKNNMGLPRGLRNNNPYNIKLTNIKWQGKVPNAKNTDKVFEQFTSLEYGLRAAMINTRTHIRQGYNTVPKLITKHAPASDNNPTDRFIAYVLEKSGFGVNELVSVTDPRFLKIVNAVIHFENGRPISQTQINSAYEKYIA